MLSVTTRVLYDIEMPKRSYPCRYCGADFTPELGKPGYIDECPDCLHERTRPKPARDLAAQFIARFPKRRKALKDFRKVLAALGMDDAMIDSVVAEALRLAVLKGISKDDRGI
jgi:hypothetical protein